MSNYSGTRILTIANQKGGVGKTTTAINLATALAAIEKKVLIVDLDPQGNASTGLGVDRDNRQHSSYELLIGDANLSQCIIETAVPRLSIVPATQDLMGLEMEILDASDRVFKLKSILHERSVEMEHIDFVLIDCPPSLNLLTLNALAASNAIIVPLQCEFFALEGLSQLLETVEQVRGSINPDLEIHGIVLTMYDSRNNLSAQVVEDVRAYMGKKVYETVIPRNVRISEAPSYGKPAILYDLKCSGSQAYLKLAAEVIRKERKLTKSN